MPKIDNTVYFTGKQVELTDDFWDGLQDDNDVNILKIISYNITRLYDGNFTTRTADNINKGLYVNVMVAFKNHKLVNSRTYVFYKVLYILSSVVLYINK